VSRRYRVRVFGTVEQHLLERLAEGVTIEGVRYDPIIADVERKLGRNSWLSMTLTEGKNREVRRVVEAMGLQVTRLIRVAYGPFQLDDLEPGKVAEADRRDVDRLMKTLKLA
jgi:23S rRNA pseudouridine2605 synthase